MARHIHTYPDPILTKKSEPITEITPEIKELAKEMLELMYEHNGIGLAAPQAGENIRLITVDLSGPEKREDPHIFINPEILTKLGETESEEGCLSVPGYRNTIKRAKTINFRAKNLNGETIEFQADDLLAICLQHETDHLNGILFIDRLSRLKRSLYEKKRKKWNKEKK